MLTRSLSAYSRLCHAAMILFNPIHIIQVEEKKQLNSRDISQLTASRDWSAAIKALWQFTFENATATSNRSLDSSGSTSERRLSCYDFQGTRARRPEARAIKDKCPTDTCSAASLFMPGALLA